MKASGTTLDARDFYWAVNLAFHSAESEIYEREHARMIADLPEKWGLLLAPLKARPLASIRWLDVGCGPGVLGGVVAAILGDGVKHAVFVDPNANMLRLCEAKAREWRFSTEFVQGCISELESKEEFDLITCNSVLHHVVELRDFCGTVARLLTAGGLFASCYDPRREVTFDRVLARRRALARCGRAWRVAPRAMKKVYRRFVPSSNGEQIIEAEANRELMRAGAISRPLDIRSIWAVTDFHVPEQLGGFGRGISEEELRSYLPGLTMREYFSYCFFGHGPIAAPFRYAERLLFKRRDPHGALFGASWTSS